MLPPHLEAQRRQAIAWAVALTAQTPLAPDLYESDLLEQYAQGTLTLHEVLSQLDTRVNRILYRSQAVRPFSPAQLTDLLEQSRAWNEQYQITGLLCYADSGHFVQVLEGPAQHVQQLFAKIRQDTRHHQITLLSDQTSANRWFPDWQMALSEPHPHDYFWLLGYLEAQGRHLARPQVPVSDPQLLTLLQQFSVV